MFLGLIGLALFFSFLWRAGGVSFGELLPVAFFSFFVSVTLGYFACSLMPLLQLYFFQNCKFTRKFRSFVFGRGLFQSLWVFFLLLAPILVLWFVVDKYFPNLGFLFCLLFLLPSVLSYVFWSPEELELELKASALEIKFCNSCNEFEAIDLLNLDLSSLLKHQKNSDNICLHFSLPKTLLVVPLRAFDSKNEFDSFYENVSAETKESILPNFQPNP